MNGDESERALSIAERERLWRLFPEEFNEGARCGYSGDYPGEREPGGYPKGFHRWPLERRNAWFAGFNVGFHDRLRGQEGDDDG